MPSKPIERELQHDFGGARRPSTLTLDVVEAFEKAADVKQKPGKFRARGIERVTHPLPRCDHRFGKDTGALCTAAAATAHGTFPVRRRARHHVRTGEIAAQPLTGLQLMRCNQGAPVAAAPSGEPDQRTFRFVDNNAVTAVFGFNFAMTDIEVSAAEFIDERPLHIRYPGRRFSHSGFHARGPRTRKKPHASST